MAEFNIVCSSQTGELTVNFEELEKQLKQELKKYDYVVTEDMIKQASKDKADINKFASSIDDKRKEIKNQYCEPLVEFERKMNILRDTAKEGYNKINDQIKAFDEKFKEEKQLEIAEYFVSKNFTLVSLERLFDSKWLNKTCKDWKEQLDKKIDTINQELDLINNFGVSDEEKEEIKGYYLDCLNVMEARNKFDAQKARREQLKKAQEQKQMVQEQKHTPQVKKQAPSEQLQEETPKQVQQVKKQRIVAEFIATREFYDYLNEAIKKYKPQVKILKKEDVE